MSASLISSACGRVTATNSTLEPGGSSGDGADATATDTDDLDHGEVVLRETMGPTSRRAMTGAVGPFVGGAEPPPPASVNLELRLTVMSR
jgi:hypothetical protein